MKLVTFKGTDGPRLGVLVDLETSILGNRNATFRPDIHAGID